MIPFMRQTIGLQIPLLDEEGQPRLDRQNQPMLSERTETKADILFTVRRVYDRDGKEKQSIVRINVPKETKVEHGGMVDFKEQGQTYKVKILTVQHGTGVISSNVLYKILECG